MQCEKALTRALAVQSAAAEYGFDWPDEQAVLAKVREEVSEIEAALNDGDQEAIEAEYADLVFVVLNLGRHIKQLHSHEIDNVKFLGSILEQASDKFVRRFTFVKNRTQDQKPMSLAMMEAAWQTAKQQGL